MNAQGRDCTLAVKTEHCEMDIPYTEETIRENIFLWEENPCIEGNGTCKVMRKYSGAAGCIVTPLTINAVPLFLYIALGDTDKPVFVSGTRNVYQYRHYLVPMEDTEPFGLIQYRGDEYRYYPFCYVKGFELRILRDESIKLKMDISSGYAPFLFLYNDKPQNQTSEMAQYQTSKMSGTAKKGERFKGENVNYKINGKEYGNIYGLTLSVKKGGGVKTEVWIRRVLEIGADLPEMIEELTITALLLRDKYEERHFGKIRITLRCLFLHSDETSIECPDSVIGPLRYISSCVVTANIFSSGEAGIP